jgi:hypothetical protein
LSKFELEYAEFNNVKPAQIAPDPHLFVSKHSKMVESLLKPYVTKSFFKANYCMVKEIDYRSVSKIIEETYSRVLEYMSSKTSS